VKAGSHVCPSPTARHQRFPRAYSCSRTRARPPARPFLGLHPALDPSRSRRPLSRLPLCRAAATPSRYSRLLAPPPLVVATFKRPCPAGDAPTSCLYPLLPVPLPRPAALTAVLLPRAALLAPAPVVSTPLEEPGFAYPPSNFSGQMREDLFNGEQFVRDGCSGEISALSLFCPCT
jgi:hypothetical protein